MPYKILTVLLASLALASAWAAPESAPDRQRGEGPFDQLILRGVTVVNGEGAPPVGPMDVVIENGRVTYAGPEAGLRAVVGDVAGIARQFEPQ